MKITAEWIQKHRDTIKSAVVAQIKTLALSTSATEKAVPAGVMLAKPKPQRFTQDQEAVETLIDAALAQAASPIPAAKIRAAILAATDPEDLMERLAKLYGGEDAVAFQDLMAKSLFAADVLGFVNAGDRVNGGQLPQAEPTR